MILLLHTTILNVFEMLRKLFTTLELETLILDGTQPRLNQFYIKLAEHMAGNNSFVDIAYLTLHTHNHLLFPSIKLRINMNV